MADFTLPSSRYSLLSVIFSQVLYYEKELNLAFNEMVHFQLEFCALLSHLGELSCYLYYLEIQKNKVRKEKGDFVPA